MTRADRLTTGEASSKDDVPHAKPVLRVVASARMVESILYYDSRNRRVRVTFTDGKSGWLGLTDYPPTSDIFSSLSEEARTKHATHCAFIDSQKTNGDTAA